MEIETELNQFVKDKNKEDKKISNTNILNNQDNKEIEKILKKDKSKESNNVIKKAKNL